MMSDEFADLGLRVNPVAPHTGEHVVVMVHAYIPSALPVTVRMLLYVEVGRSRTT